MGTKQRWELGLRFPGDTTAVLFGDKFRVMLRSDKEPDRGIDLMMSAEEAAELRDDLTRLLMHLERSKGMPGDAVLTGRDLGRREIWETATRRYVVSPTTGRVLQEGPRRVFPKVGLEWPDPDDEEG